MDDEVPIFKCIELNVNSLKSKNKQHELKTLIDERNPEIMLLVETKLNEGKKFQIPNYNIFRNDRLTDSGGGTAILVKTQFVCTHIECLPTISSFEYTAIKLKCNSGKSIYFAAIYKKPSNSINTNEISQLIFSFDKNQFILAGDFNCKHTFWGNVDSNSEGNKLYNWLYGTMDIHNLKLLKPNEPTCVRANSESYLDLFIIDDNIRVCFEPNESKLTTLDFDSDHRAVEMKIYMSEKMEINEKVLSFNWCKGDFAKMSEQIDRRLNELHLPIVSNIENNQIDEAVRKLNEIFITALHSCVPTLEFKKNTLIKLSQQSVKLLAEKKSVRRSYHRNKHSQHANAIKCKLKLLANMTYNSIVADYKAFWERKFSELRIDNNIFKNIKNLSNYKKHLEMPQSMTENSNNTQQLRSNIDKANAFAKHFMGAHNLTLNSGQPEFDERVKAYAFETFETGKITDFAIDHMDDWIDGDDPNISSNFVSIGEVVQTIKSRNAKKSFGNDMISNFVLKKIASRKLCTTLTILFNHIINNSYVPYLWKEAIIIPIPKPGKDPKIVNNYRPISKISCIAKVFEKIIAKKIQIECDNLEIDFERQFGFRPGRTTCHALFKLVTEISYGLNDGIPTHVVALDFEKAYDTVWILGLIYKMHFLMGFSLTICKLLLSFLSNRKYSVQVNNNFSNPYMAPAGIPQGSVLSCLLFIIYVADFPKHTGALNIKTTQFADDTLLSVQSVLTDHVQNDLNSYLSEIGEYLNIWKIKINTDKCEQLAILGNIKQTNSKVRKNAKQIEIKFNDQIIPKTENLKYLGINFTRNFIFNSHINKIKSKMLAAYFALKNIFTNRKIDKQIKLLAYKQIIRPIALYGAPIWLQVSKNQINKIALVERKILRSASGLYRRQDSVKYYPNDVVYKECNMAPIEGELIKNTIKFLDRIMVNRDLAGYVRYSENYMGGIHYYNSKPPAYIKYLEDEHKLFINENEIYYKNLPTIDQWRVSHI